MDRVTWWVIENTLGKFVCYVWMRDSHGSQGLRMKRTWARDGSWTGRCEVCGHRESSRD